MGCGKPLATGPNSPVTKAPPTSVQTVETAAGSADVYAPHGIRKLLWTIAWKAAELTAANNALSTGAMHTVHGVIYRGGKPTVHFAADGGQGNAESKILQLHGHVIIIALRRTSSLTCDSLVYDGHAHLLHALGNVQFRTASGKVGTFPSVEATPDLRRVGTPDLFNQP